MSSGSAHVRLGLDRPLSRLAAVALSIGWVGIWLLGRRYTGLTHDASVYVVQAFRRLDPGAFSGDLFFRFGAQDAFTLFPHLYAPLVAALGAGPAALAVTLTGQALFLGAAAAFALRLAPARVAWWSLVLLASVSGYYGGVGVFRIAETFATARVLAEPLVVEALAAQLAGHHRGSALLALAALLLHPLVAAPGIAVLVACVVLPRAPARAAAALGVLFLVALAVLALLPLARIDAEWRGILEERSPHLFLRDWPVADWARVAWSFIVTALALRSLDGDARRLAVCVSAVAVLGLATSAIAVDAWGIALVASAQPWRALWLLQFLAIVLVPVAMAGWWRAGPAGKSASLLLAASCCFGRDELGWALALSLLACACATIARSQVAWIGERALRVLALAASCAAATGLLFELQSRLPQAYGSPISLAGADAWVPAGSLAVLLLVAGGLYLVAHVQGLVALAVSIVVATTALFAWDARRPWPRYLERAPEELAEIRRHLPPHAQVYWPGPYSRVWLGLGVPAWFSVDQGAGVVFHRETAQAYRERHQATRDLVAASENCAYGGSTCQIDARPVDALCARPDAPDYLVLGFPTQRPLIAAKELPPDLGPGRQQALLFRCK